MMSVLKNVKGMLTERFKRKILDRFEMQDCKSRESPCEPKLEYTEDAENA